MIRTTILLTLSVGAAAMIATSASASHFRGATLIPEVDANGKLTVNSVSYWRINAPDDVDTISVSGVGSVSNTSITTDTTTDTRRAEVREVFQTQLPGAGSYNISFGSCCWVSGVPNISSGSFGTASTVVWDGATATKPITFDLENIQQEVSRNAAYSDNLGVTGPGPFTYDDTFLATGMSAQPTNYSIDSTGTITMPLSTTSAIADNGGNIGADIAFSGEINSADGSSVQFVWVFDATNAAANNAPNVADVVINATVGDVINQLVTATDPDGDAVSLLLASFNGPGGAVSGASFTDNGNDTGTFGWNSAGFAPGTYIAAIQGSDGSLTDNGQITINLSTGQTPPPSPIPLPAGGLLGLSGFALLGGLGWRRRRG